MQIDKFDATSQTSSIQNLTFPVSQVEKYGLSEMIDSTDLGGGSGGTFNGGTVTGNTIFSGANVTIDGSAASKTLYLKSAFGGDDDGVGTHFDQTSRLIQESFQRAGTNNWGEVTRVYLKKSDAKAMTAYYFPNSYDGNGDPVGNFYPKVWFGAHADSTGHTGYHNHWSIEVPDSMNLLRTRFGINFAASGADDPTSVGTGLDKTTILTNNADMVISTHFDTYQAGDTTIPTGPKGQASLRLKGVAGVPQDIEFGRNIGSDARRWVLRNSADAEAGSNAGAKFQLVAYDDAGTVLGTALNVDRDTGLFTIGTTSSYRLGGLVINKSNTGNAFRINNTFTGGTSVYASTADITSRVLSGDVTGDSSQRVVILASGQIEVGSGAATRDVNLYRSAADVWKTDDSLNAVLGLRINTTSVAGSVGALAMANAATIPGGTPTAGGVIYVEAGALKYKGSAGTVTVLGPA